jgi:ribonuclease HI
MGIVKALQAIETIKINKNVPRTIIIHTDSRITLDSLKNKKNCNHLIEEIRKKTITLEKENWNIEYTWIKAHTGHYGNELADKLAKEAIRNHDICYNKFPKSETEHQEREKIMEKWQQQWNHTNKELATKEFSPNINDRLKTKINLTPIFMAMTTAHRKTRSYLHRFKIIESPECPCANGNQPVDHLLYQCNKLNSEREALIGYISKEDN